MDTATHPKPAVSAIIVKDDRVLLVKRGHEPSFGLWSFPGGSIELGETAREAITREVLEETCLHITPGEVVDVRDAIGKSDGQITFHYVIIIFRAEVVSGTLKAASDAADARWFPITDVPTLQTTPGLLDRLTKATRTPPDAQTRRRADAPTDPLDNPTQTV